MYPTVELISAIACIIIFGAMLAFAVAYKQRLDGSAVCVYALVTHRWHPSNAQPSGVRQVDPPADPAYVLFCERITPTSSLPNGRYRPGRD
jgi:hypothetical protein